MSAALKRPVCRRAPPTTSPRKRNAAAEGTTKKAIRREPASIRARSLAATSSALPAARDISGSSAADTAMPKRLTGMR